MRPVLLCVLLSLSACSAETVTEIVISVATDLKIPQELALVDLLVYNQVNPRPDAGIGSPVVQEAFDVDPVRPGHLELPATFGLFPSGNPTNPIHIVVAGRTVGKQWNVTREARLAFSPDKILLLRMNLIRSCLNITCAAGQTCTETGCRPIDSPFVEVYYPKFPPMVDGGIDGPIPDATPDLAPSDLPGDGPTTDSPPTDGPPKDGPPPIDGPPKDGPPPIDGSPKDGPPQSDTIPTAGCFGGWCNIVPGTFSMGSPPTESCRDADENLHQVQLTRWFQIAQHEVTQNQWLAVFPGFNPSSNPTCGGNCPVEKVTWHMAVNYCNELSKGSGLTPCYTCSGVQFGVQCSVAGGYAGNIYLCPGFRLPTEAEWEYAARAGTTSALHNGQPLTVCSGTVAAASAIAWYDQNSSGAKHEVAQKTANNWQLYDMAGNVSEWVADWLYPYPTSGTDVDPYWPPKTSTACTGDLLAGVRGGRFSYNVGTTRTANRASKCQGYSVNDHGFRCARGLTGVTP